MNRKFEQRIKDLIATADRTQCWPYWNKLRPDGYGRVTLDGGKRNVPAHRLAYELLTGESIQEGMVCDHLCRHPACVNPFHVEVVTQGENIRRGIRATQTHCKRGHPLSGDNLCFTKPTVAGRSPKRACRSCRRINQRRRAGFPKKRGPRVPKKFCKHGHAMTGDNVFFFRFRGYDCRGCVTCRKAREAKAAAKISAERRARRAPDEEHQRQLSAAGNSRVSRQTHCKNGHPLSGDNVRWEMRNGHACRSCRACKSEWSRVNHRSKSKD